MKLFPSRLSRAEYLTTQITRSQRKFGFCKVSALDVDRYHHIVLADATRRGARFAGPILCLGTRNGREIDLFRLRFTGPRLAWVAARRLEVTTYSLVSLAPRVEMVRRSDIDQLDAESVVGVEVNPQAKRTDVLIASFDEMPAAWEHRFGLLFSNAFDHSHDPARTAREWRRVARVGGYLVVCFPQNAEPSLTDPVGQVTLADVLELFGGSLVYYRDRASVVGYNEAILRFDQ
jgi:Methyltransferase domain